MPANKEYLSSPVQRFYKLTCGLIGGYLLSALLHISLGFLLPNKQLYLSISANSIYVVWVVLFCVVYLFKNGVKAWLIYGLSIVALALINLFILKPMF